MFEFTVPRSLWLRGDGDSYLLHPESGKMCCLGILGLACGIRPDEMKGVVTPAHARGHYDNFPEAIFDAFGNNSEDADELMGVNDNRNITDQEREKQLTERFKLIGIKVTFVD